MKIYSEMEKNETVVQALRLGFIVLDEMILTGKFRNERGIIEY